MKKIVITIKSKDKEFDCIEYLKEFKEFVFTRNHIGRFKVVSVDIDEVYIKNLDDEGRYDRYEN